MIRIILYIVSALCFLLACIGSFTIHETMIGFLTLFCTLYSFYMVLKICKKRK